MATAWQALSHGSTPLTMTSQVPWTALTNLLRQPLYICRQKRRSCESRPSASGGLSGGNPEKLLGGDSNGATPVPVPNTEVKPVYVDGTARVTGWESKKLPGLNQR